MYVNAQFDKRSTAVANVLEMVAYYRASGWELVDVPYSETFANREPDELIYDFKARDAYLYLEKSGVAHYISVELLSYTPGVYTVSTVDEER